MPPPMKRKLGEPSELFNMRVLFVAQISTAEETFQSHIIDSTIFQTNSFDVLSEFTLLVNQKRHSNKNLKIFVSFKEI